MNKENFNLIAKLLLNYNWLGNRLDQLSSLLFDDCKNETQRHLIIELIGRVKYVDDGILLHDLKSYLDFLENTGINKTDLLFTATAMDSDPDSSHVIAYALKNLLEREGWVGQKVISDANKIVKEARDRKTIIFVDEFIGTGHSVCSRIKTISARLSAAKISGFKFGVFALACMEGARDKIKDEFEIDVFSNNFLKKGISDYRPPEQAALSIAIMRELEHLLSTECGQENLESLGWGQAEALFARENGNSPNSVFPVFWWPEYSNKSTRSTIFVRAMGR